MVEEYSEIADEWVTGKKKKRRIFILSITIAIILIISYFVITYESHPSTPDGVAFAYAERISDNDIDGAFRLTTLRFTDMFDDYVEDADWVYNIDFTFSNMKVLSPPELSTDEREYWENQINLTENDWNIEVQEWLIVDYNRTAEFESGETEEDHGRLACFKIDSKWYLHIPFN